MTKPKVLISDKMDPNAAKIFEERGCDVDVITGETPEQLIARISEYDGLAIRSSTKVTPKILAAATNLKLEVVVIPVADVDRAKRFYARQGFDDLGATSFSFEGRSYSNQLLQRNLR